MIRVITWHRDHRRRIQEDFRLLRSVTLRCRAPESVGSVASQLRLPFSSLVCSSFFFPLGLCFEMKDSGIMVVLFCPAPFGKMKFMRFMNGAPFIT